MYAIGKGLCSAYKEQRRIVMVHIIGCHPCARTFVVNPLFDFHDCVCGHATEASEMCYLTEI